MQIQLIRSATLRVRYNGRFFIVDPFLAAKGTVRSFAGIAPNPIVELPCTPEEAIAGVEMALVSHLHVDHFDEVAAELLPKDLPILCQPGDEEKIKEKGFTAVTPITQTLTWQGITFTRTAGQHGTGEVGQRMGQVSGFVWQAAGEPTVYWAGDTIWYEAVADVIHTVRPDVIITHSGGARFKDGDPIIIMDASQTIAVCQAAPQATIIAVHLESLDHCPVTRADLRADAWQQAIPVEQLRIPQDGETLVL